MIVCILHRVCVCGYRDYEGPTTVFPSALDEVCFLNLSQQVVKCYLFAGVVSSLLVWESTYTDVGRLIRFYS